MKAQKRQSSTENLAPRQTSEVDTHIDVSLGCVHATVKLLLEELGA